MQDRMGEVSSRARSDWFNHDAKAAQPPPCNSRRRETVPSRMPGISSTVIAQTLSEIGMIAIPYSKVLKTLAWMINSRNFSSGTSFNEVTKETRFGTSASVIRIRA